MIALPCQKQNFREHGGSISKAEWVSVDNFESLTWKIFHDKNYPSCFLPNGVKFTKKSDRKGEKPHDFTHVEYKTKKKHMSKQNENKLVDTDNRLVVTRGGKERGRENWVKRVRYMVVDGN